MKKLVDKAVHKLWAKDVHRLLTGCAPSLTDLLTELLTIGAKYATKHQKRDLKDQIHFNTVDTWNAAREGFGGENDLTFRQVYAETKPTLARAFKFGQELRLRTIAKYRNAK